MARFTSVEVTLKRLLRLCPDISLSTSDIQLIIDGKLNEVISRHKGTYVEPVEEVSMGTVSTEEFTDTTSNDDVTVTTSFEDDKSFDEYFVTKQED